MGFAEKGSRVGKSLGGIFDAYQAARKKRASKESTLSFLDELSQQYDIDDSFDSPDDLLGLTDSGLPPEQEAFEELLNFMTDGDTDEMSPVGFDPDYDTEKASKYRQAKETVDMYRSVFSQPGDVDPRAFGVLKDLNKILNPSQKGMDSDQRFELETLKSENRLELEREKGDLRAEQSEKLYDLKSKMAQEEHKRKLELENKRNQYRIHKMEQSADDRVRALTLKNEGADILNQVVKGDKEPDAALKQIDRAISELDSDIISRRQELNEFKDDNPSAAAATSKAITDLERTRRDLTGYQRRISDRVGRTDQGREKADKKLSLQNDLAQAKKNSLGKTGELKAKYDKVIRIIEKKLEALE